MKNIDELIIHIKKHRDAVIIIGGGVNPFKSNNTVKEFNEHYNRKNLVRNYDELMKFYTNNVAEEVNDSRVYELIQNIDNSLILDQNINGSISASYLHGHVNLFKCMKCKIIVPIEAIKCYEQLVTKEACECCGGNLRPTVLLAGERYDQIIFDDFKVKILNTHTLILIGMDYNEDPLLNFISDYGDMKSQLNAEGNPENERVIVAIQENEEEFNLNDLTFCEFLVKGNITDSVSRLVDKL